MASGPRFACARARTLDDAHTVVLGADTQGAGAASPARAPCAEVVRLADRENPGLSELDDDGAGLHDLGDVPLEGEAMDQVAAVRREARELLGDGKRTIVIGGDHLVKYALLAAVSDVARGPVGVVYLDAHGDCAPSDDLYFGSILHHAWKLPGLSPERTVLVGTRQLDAAERDAVHARGPHVVRARAFVAEGLAAVLDRVSEVLDGCESVVLSIDLDGLRPEAAPAVEAPVPGGPSLDEVLELLRRLAERHPLVAMDVTEFLPELDPAELTAKTVVRLVKELAAVPPRGDADAD